MIEQEKNIILMLADLLNDAAKGQFAEDFDLGESNSKEISILLNSTINLIKSISESYTFVNELSIGNLNFTAPRKNLLLSPFKNLQANLRHLTWQVQQIAKGDYKQNVDFMGDFSDAFNLMIAQLRERYELEVDIKEKDEIFSLLFEKSEDGIILFMNNRIIDCNPKAVSMIGAESKNDIIGLQPNDISPILQPDGSNSADKSLFYMKQAYKTGSQIFEWVILNKESQEMPLEIMLTAIPYKGETMIYSTCRDISERKKSEQIIIDSQKKLNQANTAKDKFFSIIAHDLRNPFNVLLNSSKILAETFDDLAIDEVKSTINDIKNSAQSTFALLENLLEWSRTQRNKIAFICEEIDLYEMAFNSLYIYGQSAKKKSINLINMVEPDSIVYADRHMLNTIFRNLVSNAIKFTPEWGNITISAEKSDDAFQVSVIDSGIGISPIDVEKLFKIDVSHTTIGTNSEKGTGLGLVICKEFIEKHNITKSSGKIWVESTFGSGTAFHFTLPNFDFINLKVNDNGNDNQN